MGRYYWYLMTIKTTNFMVITNEDTVVSRLRKVQPEDSSIVR